MLWWDGDKYATVLVVWEGRVYTAEIKWGYIYTTPGRLGDEGLVRINNHLLMEVGKLYT